MGSQGASSKSTTLELRLTSKPDRAIIGLAARLKGIAAATGKRSVELPLYG
jgi:hypothetical protein